MSKLAEKIRRAMRPQPQQLGFVTSRTSGSATMLLAGLARDGKSAAEALRAGADVAILGSPESAGPIGAAKEVADAVAGAWIQGKSEDEAKSYREAGFDFVLFDPDRASATAVLDESAGYVVRLPRDITDTEVRAMEEFALDAVYVGTLDRALTVRRQIELRRVYALTRKPLMATISPGVSPAELQALRDTNVVIVAVEGDANLERLRAAIDAMPPRARRKDDERPTPLVPRAVAADGEGEDIDE